MKDKICLEPGDMIQLKIGLKIENVGDNVLEFEMPNKIDIYPLEISLSQSPTDNESHGK